MAKPDKSGEAIERRSLAVGKWANLLMGVSGVAAAYASHSDALLVDGLYSGVNFVSAIIAARVSSSVMRPADRRFPFGYYAHETLYVKYRSLVLLGIMAFAMFGAVSKIITYATGGTVPQLVFGPIFIYIVLMVAICFGLALWHRYNWQRSGKRSQVLSTESRAAVIDGVLSVGAGGGLLAASLLRKTPLGFIVPIADSIVVLILCACIINQPVRMFVQSLREVAGSAAELNVVRQARSATEKILGKEPFDLLELAVTKMGRSHLIVPYLQPEGETSADAIDALRRRLAGVYQEFLGQVKVEIIITSEHPYTS